MKCVNLSSSSLEDKGTHTQESTAVQIHSAHGARTDFDSEYLTQEIALSTIWYAASLTLKVDISNTNK